MLFQSFTPCKTSHSVSECQWGSQGSDSNHTFSYDRIVTVLPTLLQQKERLCDGALAWVSISLIDPGLATDVPGPAKANPLVQVKMDAFQDSWENKSFYFPPSLRLIKYSISLIVELLSQIKAGDSP